MGKKRPPRPDESQLFVRATPSSSVPIIDTHTHLHSTFAFYKEKYPEGSYSALPKASDFVRKAYEGRNVRAMVDVFCEAKEIGEWKELADSAATSELRDENWNGINYWFVMGVHPHESKDYNDEVEARILEAMSHPRNVGWGEMGLDYHYDLSPRDVQREVFKRQLRHAVRLQKPLTIHTREAEEDTEQILREFVPQNHRIHIHCFTDSPEFAKRLLEYFPNLYIGITGVITYSTNENTSAVIKHLASSTLSPSSAPQRLRILLETDAPYMVPGNIYKSLELKNGSRLPLCHTAMIPWTAEFVANVAKEVGADYDAERVMSEANSNAFAMYGLGQPGM